MSYRPWASKGYVFVSFFVNTFTTHSPSPGVSAAPGVLRPAPGPPCMDRHRHRLPQPRRQRQRGGQYRADTALLRRQPLPGRAACATSPGVRYVAARRDNVLIHIPSM